MKKFAVPVLAAALALAACADSTPDDDAAMADGATADAAAADGTPVATQTNTVVVPGATKTVVATTPAETGDKVSIGAEGVSASVGDSNTRVKVNTDGNTISVEQK